MNNFENFSYIKNEQKIAIIVPCYNEEEVIHETSKRLLEKIKSLAMHKFVSVESKIVFIDDGSSDNTWHIIEKLCFNNPDNFAGIKLSKNKGHQNALLCGLILLKDNVDAIISIDADLQDDINVIDEMLYKYYEGSCEIVYAVRFERKNDSFFKKLTAYSFYYLVRFLGVDIVFNHADFRLMGKKALYALAEYKEVNLFLRGIIPMLGFKTEIVHYSRNKRFAGKSKYPLSKMLKFAIDGITSFSIKPIRLITFLGIIIFSGSIVMILYFIIIYLNHHTVPGWASIVCSLLGIGGLILFSIGITGEYIGKIYLETKQRPRFHVEKYLYEGKDFIF